MLREHIKSAHLQAVLWKAADKINPPELDITKLGWTFQEGCPTPTYGIGDVAPKEVLKVISCQCSSCSTAQCSCKTQNISRTSYCSCEADVVCCNPYTLVTSTEEADDDDDNNDDDNDDDER